MFAAGVNAADNAQTGKVPKNTTSIAVKTLHLLLLVVYRASTNAPKIGALNRPMIPVI